MTTPSPPASGHGSLPPFAAGAADMVNRAVDVADNIRIMIELVDDLLSRACDGDEDATRCTTQAHVLTMQISVMAANLTDRLETTLQTVSA